MLAKKNNTSINKTIISLLHKSLGIDDNNEKMRDLSDIAGTWNDDDLKRFMSDVKMFDAIDEEVWK